MKKLSIDQIKNGELIGKPEPITVEIKINGEDCEFDTHIMPFSYKTAVAQMRAYGAEKEALAGILASVIVDDGGTAVFTEDDIRENFNQALVDAIWQKVVEINMLGKKSTSMPKTSSSLKSESQPEGPTQKPSRSNTAKSKNTKHTSGSTEVLTSGEESSKK